MFATLDFCKNLVMHHAEKNKNVIYRLARSVLKNILSRSQKRPSAFGLGPFLRPRQNIFPVRTSHPVNNIYIFYACVNVTFRLVSQCYLKICILYVLLLLLVQENFLVKYLLLITFSIL